MLVGAASALALAGCGTAGTAGSPHPRVSSQAPPGSGITAQAGTVQNMKAAAACIRAAGVQPQGGLQTDVSGNGMATGNIIGPPPDNGSYDPEELTCYANSD